MRSTFPLVALAVAAVLVVAIVVHERGDSPAPAEVGTATLVGDSLNIGVERYLPGALPHWRIVANDRVGRVTSEGVAELRAGRPPLSPYVVVSLGTNDPPTAVDRFRTDVGSALRLIGPKRCVIWATIWRDGAPNEKFNAVLREAAEANPRVRLVAWAEMVDLHHEWLAADGIHGNEAGYRERARAVAEAAHSCAPETAAAVSG
jgi:lysophospholipase L1-like esterase